MLQKNIIQVMRTFLTIIEGKIEGKAGRGRRRTPFMEQIIEDLGKTNYKELKVAVMVSDE